MNKLKLLLITGLLAVFPTSLFADGIKVLNAQRAMLSTQYAQDEFTKLDQDADFIADRERLELLQTEGQALVEKFQQDQETLSDEEIANMQTKLQDKQTEIQFLTNKLQTKAQELEMVVTPEALFYADPDLDITDEVTALLDLAASKSEE